MHIFLELMVMMEKERMVVPVLFLLQLNHGLLESQ